MGTLLEAALETQAEIEQIIANLEATRAGIQRMRPTGTRRQPRVTYLTGRRVSVPGSGNAVPSFSQPDFGAPSSGPNGGGG